MKDEKEPTIDYALKQLGALQEENLISNEDLSGIIKTMKTLRQKAVEMDKPLKKD